MKYYHILIELLKYVPCFLSPVHLSHAIDSLCSSLTIHVTLYFTLCEQMALLSFVLLVLFLVSISLDTGRGCDSNVE